MTKQEAKQEFIENVRRPILERWLQSDFPALCEAWNNFTDRLCKEGRITARQYDRWLNPFTRKSVMVKT